MATFEIAVKVWNPADPSRVAEVKGVQKVRQLKFQTIEGHTVERDLAAVFLSAEGFTGGDNVVMAEAGDIEVLGAHSLDSLGLAVDPVNKKLMPLVVALGL